mmetsp:Transcript_6728/g.11947  ORF Transcript_6728/g.11947 Transcript_6728/m.11947 type:complete len:236 (-) Transcript_6728:126-833(-)
MDNSYKSGAVGFAYGLACSLLLFLAYRLFRLCLSKRNLRARKTAEDASAQTHLSDGDDKCACGAVTKVIGNETLAVGIHEGADIEVPKIIFKETQDADRENTGSTRFSDPYASFDGSSDSSNSYYGCIPDEEEARATFREIHAEFPSQEIEQEWTDTWELGKDCATPKMSAKVCVNLEEARTEMGFEGDIEDIAGRVCASRASSRGRIGRENYEERGAARILVERQCIDFFGGSI